MDQPAAVNRIHWQRSRTVELFRTPHDGGPSPQMAKDGLKRLAVKTPQVRMKAERNQAEKIGW